MFMKGFIKKLGFTTVLIAILGIAVNAQVADFKYFSPCDGSVTKFVSTSTYPAGIDAYLWYFNDGSNPAYGAEVENTFPQVGIYYVTLELYRYTSATDSVMIGSESKNVEILPIPQPSFTAASACVGNRTTFVNTSTIADEEVYEWDWIFGDGETDGSKNPMHFYPYPDIYTVSLTVETVDGCFGSYSTQVRVYETPEPVIKSELYDVCYGEVANLSVINYGDNVQWSTIPANTSPGIYSPNIAVSNLQLGKNVMEVTVYSTHNDAGFTPVACESKAQIEVYVHPNPEITLAVSEESVVPGGEVELSVASATTNLVEWWWTPVYGLNDPASPNPVTNIEETTIFNLDVTDEFGCKGSAIITVDVDLKPNNILTPNGDGKNDVWLAASKNLLESEGYELVIYNRWGEEVLNQKGYNNDWDGTSNGDQLPEGAYYYLIKHGDISYTGAITLLR